MPPSLLHGHPHPPASCMAHRIATPNRTAASWPTHATPCPPSASAHQDASWRPARRIVAKGTLGSRTGRHAPAVPPVDATPRMGTHATGHRRGALGTKLACRNKPLPRMDTDRRQEPCQPGPCKNRANSAVQESCQPRREPTGKNRANSKKCRPGGSPPRGGSGHPRRFHTGNSAASAGLIGRTIFRCGVKVSQKWHILT